MMTTLWKLKNIVKNFDWGSIDDIPKYFHINNPDRKPLAEIWMGVHPAGCSIAINPQGEAIELDQLIKNNPLAMLGEQTYQKFAGLPYLFKILSAKEPLSIQVHPQLTQAQAGFIRENQLGIPLDSPNRNYKDANHKPELIYAITPFLAMNGFRPIKEILSFFDQLTVPIIKPYLAKLRQNQTAIGLKQFFHTLLTLNKADKQQAIIDLLASIQSSTHRPFTIIKSMVEKYPDDCGVFAPLILNVIELTPGQAMFLNAQTPHAYLKGTGLEIMANSDNVLRAGLTNKHIDIEELFNNTIFNSIPLTNLITVPVQKNNKICFPVPVDDFAFEIIISQSQPLQQTTQSGEILLCVEGEIVISTEFDHFTLNVGEAVFVAYSAKWFSYQGKGILARAFNN